MDINITYLPGTEEEQVEVIEAAAIFWEDRFTDDVTVNIYAGFTDEFSEGTIARTGVVEHTFNSSDYLSALGTDVTTAEDLDYYQGFTPNSDNISISDAQARGLGLTSAVDDGLSGHIGFSDLSYIDSDWNYDLGSPAIDDNDFDLYSVAVRAIGKVLGADYNSTNGFDGIEVDAIEAGQRVTPGMDILTGMDVRGLDLAPQSDYQDVTTADIQEEVLSRLETMIYGDATPLWIDGGGNGYDDRTEVLAKSFDHDFYLHTGQGGIFNSYDPLHNYSDTVLSGFSGDGDLDYYYGV